MDSVRTALVALLSVVVSWHSAALFAEEPNDTFAESTVLEPGTLSVTDDLTVGDGPFADTYLGAFDFDGNLLDEDDDGSNFGDGLASAVFDVPIDSSGEINFSVTGVGDFFFEGDHSEEGGYVAIVDVFDSTGDPLIGFAFNGILQSGAVDNYFDFDSSWANGTYTVELDNTASGADVDFFTFTGLTPGEMFSAETLSVGQLDTLLGWFDDTGTLLEVDDDSGTNFLSRIDGTVPANGELTFAVTGFGDDFFEGFHTEQEVYDLQLTLGSGAIPGDFEGDGDVDLFDLTNPTLGWQARYGIDLDGEDFLVWQEQFGVGTLAGIETVPEPTAAVLVLSACCLLAVHPLFR